MAACITLAGESLIAQKQGANQVLEIQNFVLAHIPNLDPNQPIDRSAGLPPSGQIVGTWPYTQKGFVAPNRVVYSLMLGSDIGDFDWNWMGLTTAEGILFAVSTVPVQQKRRNIPPLQTGNNVTRNFMLAFDGAQELTAITVDAETWQHDFTEALRAKEPTIPPGKSTDFWTGNKTWADLATAVRGVILTGLSTATSGVVAATDTLLAALGKLQAQITSLSNNKEPSISVGTNSQFWRGDKTWVDLATAVRGAALTGLSTATSSAVAATDTLLVALGKLQAQITSLSNNKLDKTATAASASTLASDITINGTKVNAGSNVTITAAATSASVMSANAAAAFGAVGTRAFLRVANADASISAGATYAGSALRTSGVVVRVSSDGNLFGSGSGSAVSGTWRAFGSCSAGGGSSNFAATEFLRIS